MCNLICAFLFLLFAVSAVAKSPCETAKNLANDLAKLGEHSKRITGAPWNPRQKGRQPFDCGGMKLFPDPDPKLAKIFWAKDTAGHGGHRKSGCHWKIYEKVGGEYKEMMCADELGNPLANKNESRAGIPIRCK